MLEWLYGILCAMTFVIGVFHPKSFVLALVTFIGVGMLYPTDGGEAAFAAAGVAIWVGIAYDALVGKEKSND